MTLFTEPLARNNGALTEEQQKLLLDSHVAVVGCGGLGGFVIEQLARIGIGRLTLFDPDTFSASNCNRQINALDSTLGSNKAKVAAERVQNMKTGCRATFKPHDFRSLPAQDWLFDAVIDCLDSIEARYDLAALCSSRDIPLVHGAVSGWYGQVGTQLPGFDLMSMIYPRFNSGNLPLPPPPVLSFIVTSVAGLQAAEAVKLLLQLPSDLHNNWMGVDLKNMTFDLM